MTEDELKVIEARAAAATPGPWRASLLNDFTDSTNVEGPEFSSTRSFGEGENDDLAWDDSDPASPVALATGTQAQIHADATFIAAARTDVPVLLAEVRRLRVSEALARAQLMTEQSAAHLYQHASETGAAIAGLNAALERIYAALDGCDASARDAVDAVKEIAPVVSAVLGRPNPIV